MDNTLRRVRAGARTYPSRVRPAISRGLISSDGLILTEPGENAIRMLDEVLGIQEYPADALL